MLGQASQKTVLRLGKMFNFEKLTVYQRSLILATNLSRVAGGFPLKYRRIQDQLIGAAISVTLNIAEGSGRYGKREKIQFYRTAQASAFEIIPILEICDNLNLLKKNEWAGEVEEICKMLSSLIKKLSTSE